MSTIKTVGIFLFNEVEVLDFAGPFEVFSIASKEGQPLFKVFTIGETGQSVKARNDLIVTPTYSFENAPPVDLLIIPGGYGAEEIEIHNTVVLDWIKKQATQVAILASVCTGAFLLAKCGLLYHKKATTHWMDVDRLEKEFPEVQVIRGVKLVDESSLITSGGISAGIHMSFHLVEKIHGKEIAVLTAKRMEYDWQ